MYVNMHIQYMNHDFLKQWQNGVTSVNTA